MENFPPDFDPTKSLNSCLKSFEKTCNEERIFGGENHNDLENASGGDSITTNDSEQSSSDVFIIEKIPVGLSAKEIEDRQVLNILRGFQQIGIECQFTSRNDDHLKFTVIWPDDSSSEISNNETLQNDKREEKYENENNDSDDEIQSAPEIDLDTFNFLKGYSEEYVKLNQENILPQIDQKTLMFLRDLENGFELRSIEGGYVNIHLGLLKTPIDKIKKIKYPEVYDVKEYCFKMLSEDPTDIELFSMVDWD
ncbi:phosphoprotein [Sena Madureira virus]|uniref:Phosphoprotein n=1 Tax=Sena Madureira virus TaxID=1272957 RepID=A0A0D3R1E6_9RHAB|nr:phosphoprotein [Sena Madureira virus]AJR28441.1 phosphoprotein [Sena Madureira virus]